MLLQLDPDDDEAEQLARMAIERRTERELARGLEEWLRMVFPVSMTDAEIADWAARLEEGSVRFRDILRMALQDSADLGVSVAVDQLDNIGFGFDWTLASTRAAEWASRYSYELVGGITETTRTRLAAAVTEWVNNGEALPSLIPQEVAPMPWAGTGGGADCVDRSDTGVCGGDGCGIPGERVVERCWWRTAMDEGKCPICGALNNKTVGLTGRFDGALPPDVRQRFPDVTRFSTLLRIHGAGAGLWQRLTHEWTITITGAEEIVRRLDNATATQTLQRAVMRSVNLLANRMAKYPPARAGSSYVRTARWGAAGRPK